jgi:hypothetical protein
MVLAQEVMRDARQLAKQVHGKLHEYAPDALDNIKAMADDDELAPAIRLKANEILLRSSGLSLEKRGDVNLTVNVGDTPDAVAIIRARLDRLRGAETPVLDSQVIPGAIEPA